MGKRQIKNMKNKEKVGEFLHDDKRRVDFFKRKLTIYSKNFKTKKKIDEKEKEIDLARKNDLTLFKKLKEEKKFIFIKINFARHDY